MKLFAALIVLATASAPAFAEEGAAQKAGASVDAAAADAKRSVTDSWVTGKVKEQFLADGLVKGRRIEVTTRRHRVTLRGTVQSTEARDRALSIVRNTEGVRDVADYLLIKADPA
jgi:osmotically-inducible protein OsmY